MGVLQSAASTDDFFVRAARALVDLVGLDSGRVLLRDHRGASFPACPQPLAHARGSAYRDAAGSNSRAGLAS